MDNASRAERAFSALLARYGEGEPLEQRMSDLLCDLRHLADEHGLDFGKVDRLAHSNYTHEVVEERHAQPAAVRVEAVRIAPGDRVRAPEGRTFHEIKYVLRETHLDPDEDKVTLDAGWGTLRLSPDDFVDKLI